MRFPAKTIQEPDLGLALIAGGKECEPLAVGAPTRARRADALRCQGDGFSAGCSNHPNAGLGLVLFPVGRSDSVRSPSAVRTQLGIVNFTKAEIVGDGNRTRLLSEKRGGQ